MDRRAALAIACIVAGVLGVLGMLFMIADGLEKDGAIAAGGLGSIATALLGVSYFLFKT